MIQSSFEAKVDCAGRVLSLQKEKARKVNEIMIYKSKMQFDVYGQSLESKR